MSANERDHGPQPLGELLKKHHLNHHDLVAASAEQVNHRMVARAVKGRRLTSRVAHKVLRALNQAAGADYLVRDAFNYLKPKTSGDAAPLEARRLEP